MHSIEYEIVDGVKVPIIPPRKEKPYDSNPVIAVCGKCGHHARRIEYMACLEDECPFRTTTY